MSDTFERVKEILIGNSFYCEETNITANASLRDDLGLDSLDICELAIALEEEFKLAEISDEEMDATTNVGLVVAMVESKRGNSNAKAASASS